MADSTELARRSISTQDGIVTAYIYDQVSVDRVAHTLYRGAAAAVYAGVTDDTPQLGNAIKDHVVLAPQGD